MIRRKPRPEIDPDEPAGKLAFPKSKYRPTTGRIEPEPRLPFAKERYPKDSRYRAHVHSHGCAIRGAGVHRCMNPIDCAHIDNGIMGGKQSDYAVINLCRAAHVEQHSIGWSRFEEKHAINRYEIAFRLLKLWIEKTAHAR